MTGTQEAVQADRASRLLNPPPRDAPHVHAVRTIARQQNMNLHELPGALVLEQGRRTYMVGYTDDGELVEASGAGHVFAARLTTPLDALAAFLTHLRHPRQNRTKS